MNGQFVTAGSQKLPKADADKAGEPTREILGLVVLRATRKASGQKWKSRYSD